MPKNKPVVVVGSINADLVATVERIPVAGETIAGLGFLVHPGGKGANQAVAVGRLGYPVRMIGRLGNDAYGEQLRASLEAAGVDTSSVAISEGSSGVAIILVSSAGENCIVVVPGANALVTPQDIDQHLAVIREAGMVLTQLEIPIETVAYLAEVCSREGIPLMLDPAPAVPLPRSLLRNVNWFTPNETECAFFLRELASSEHGDQKQSAEALRNAGIEGVMLKLGSRGAYLSAGGVEELVPPISVEAVDTTAAGDAFNGAFATALMMGKSSVESARFAAAAAAISVTRAGAQPAMPTLEEVHELLAEHRSS